jgi:hypothetical protein
MAGVRFPASSRILPTPQHTDRFWGSPSLLYNGYRELFPQLKSGRSVKLTTHLHVESRGRMVELHLHCTTRLHGVVLNWLSTGTWWQCQNDMNTSTQKLRVCAMTSYKCLFIETYGRSASQEIAHPVCNPNIHHYIQESRLVGGMWANCRHFTLPHRDYLRCA